MGGSTALRLDVGDELGMPAIPVGRCVVTGVRVTDRGGLEFSGDGGSSGITSGVRSSTGNGSSAGAGGMGST